MDNKLEIQLNSLKNIESTNVDEIFKFELLNNFEEINEYDIRNVLSATEIFNIERTESNTYRIHGKIEYLSMLNGLKTGYSTITDFFIPKLDNNYNIYNSFEFYLVKPIQNTFSYISPTRGIYKRDFEVISDNVEIFNAGFSNNVFGDPVYSFIVDLDINISEYLDGLGFPLTEIFLYCKKIPKSNSNNIPETIQRYAYGSRSSSPYFSKIKTNFSSGSYVVGDIVYGDVVYYDRNSFTEEVIQEQTYIVGTPIVINLTTTKSIKWTYNPFIPIRLRYFSDNISTANTGTTSYDQLISIPDYAHTVDDNGTGNVVWREILPDGYTDPITGIGVNHPFINNVKYVYADIKLVIKPDLSDSTTRNIFKLDSDDDNNLLTLSDPDKLNSMPLTDGNNFDKPC